ncbi:MAG: hypothetical protein K1X78_11340 [Verrucomicrobiaceae bacterium]|nr:hypothetical protein [Verrucomicrobiaceae bacterium]
MTERTFLANADYQVIDRAPLVLQAGERVRIGRRDSDWPGWIWVTAINGRGSYVPEDILTPGDDGTAEVRLPFHARDLSVVKDEPVTSVREVQGWHWCRNEDGEEGWLPAYLLRE